MVPYVYAPPDKDIYIQGAVHARLDRERAPDRTAPRARNSRCNAPGSFMNLSAMRACSGPAALEMELQHAAQLVQVRQAETTRDTQARAQIAARHSPVVLDIYVEGRGGGELEVDVMVVL